MQDSSLPTTPALEVHDLTVSYNRRPALWNIDVAIPQGVLAGIMGPNGSGKTTLLKAALGLVPLGSGWVKVYDRPLNEVRQRVSYVPQRSSVDWDFPATVYDVVLMGRYGRLGLFRRPGRIDAEITMDALQKVGMEAYRNRQIAQLSGGQQQRVFLARALAQQADLYLLDEPFAGVDMATEASIMQLLRTLQSQGKTIIVVHHDLRTAPEYFSWLMLLNQRLVAAGPINEVFTDALLNEAYGGRLTLLQQVGELFQRTEFARREEAYK